MALWHTRPLAKKKYLSMSKILAQLAVEIQIRPDQVKAAVELLDGGATVPFIARYRKEVTGGLDDIQLRELEYRLGYLRELEDRREAVIKSIQEQGKLTPELLAALQAAPTKQELEDLYLPYKPKRRTKGMIAREAGLEPLADKLFADPTLNPAVEAEAFVLPAGKIEGADFSTVPAVLDGVRDLLSERWAEDAGLVQALREWLWSEGLLRSKLADGKDENNPDVAKFRDYFDYDEPIGRVPSHRALALLRGRNEGVLTLGLDLPVDEWAKEEGIADDAMRERLTEKLTLPADGSAPLLDLTAEVPRLLVIYFALVQLTLLASARLLIGASLRVLSAGGRPLSRVLLVGTGMSFHNLRAYGPNGTEASRVFDQWLTQAACAAPAHVTPVSQTAPPAQSPPAAPARRS